MAIHIYWLILTTSQQWPFSKDVALHEYQLAFWGSPIGEIWDLEKLVSFSEAFHHG